MRSVKVELSFVAAMGLCVGCASSMATVDATHVTTVEASRSNEHAVAAMIDDWHDAAAKADESRYFGHLASDSIFLGTDASERWTKAAFAAYAHPHFAKGKAWSFHSVRRAIVFDGDGSIAHFDEDLATEKLGPARGSGVVALRNSVWVIVQYNLALTVPNGRFPETHDAVSATLLESDKGPLDSLSWLAGSWVTETKDERTEETWSAPEGGSMLGIARTIKAGKTTFIESLRIEARATGIVLVARPSGQDEAEFSLSKSATDSEKKAAFENPVHDFPKRITYQRTGDQLVAKIDGGGAPSEWTYRRAVTAAR
jgi:hypothetical protein